MTFLDEIAARPPGERDRFVEERLGIAGPDGDVAPGPGLVRFLPSGVGPVVEMLRQVPVRAEDVVVDIGSGRGKVVLLAGLLAGARVIGVEVQEPLVRESRGAIARLGLARAEIVPGDARDVPLDEGTVFYLYAPMTGEALSAVFHRLHAVARRRDIVVCALGFDVPACDWLRARLGDHFWLTILDSTCPGAVARPPSTSTLPADTARRVARELP